MIQGGYKVILILQIKRKMAAENKQTGAFFFSFFCIKPSLHLPSFKVLGLQMPEFGISVNMYQ